MGVGVGGGVLVIVGDGECVIVGLTVADGDGVIDGIGVDVIVGSTRTAAQADDANIMKHRNSHLVGFVISNLHLVFLKNIQNPGLEFFVVYLCQQFSPDFPAQAIRLKIFRRKFTE